MAIDAFLRRLVVIAGHAENGVRPCFLRKGCEFDSFHRIVGARPGNDRHAATRRLDAELNHTLVLLMGKRRRFAGRAARHQPMRPLLNLPFYKFDERSLIHLAVLERGNECDERSLEHDFGSIAPINAAGKISGRSPKARKITASIGTGKETAPVFRDFLLQPATSADYS